MQDWKPISANRHILGYKWLVTNQPEGNILLIHGIGEHAGRYKEVAQFFNQHAYNFFAPDLPGHGRSDGLRGHIHSLAHLRELITGFIGEIKKLHPESPIFLYGHSMGGNVVLNYSQQEKDSRLSGIIATSPWLILPNPPPAYLQFLAQLMSKYYPGFTQKTKLDTNGLSNNPKVIAAYLADPLVHDKITAASYIQLANSAAKLLHEKGTALLPQLVMHGGDDPITSPLGSEQFASLNDDVVHCKIWPGLKHEIHQEAEKAEILLYMVEWMKKNLDKM